MYTQFLSHLIRSLRKCHHGISELETLGLVWAMKIIRAYLLGHLCVVFTDHAASTSPLNTPNPSAELAHWAMAIHELDQDIPHVC